MATPEVKIREAREADVTALHGLVFALAQHHGQAALLMTSVESLREAGFGASPKFQALLAEVEGAIVGFTTYTRNYSIWRAAEYLNLDDVFVVETHRGLGIGEALMREAARVCRAQGLSRLRWEVEPENTSAIRFYERLGATLHNKGMFSWSV